GDEAGAAVSLSGKGFKYRHLRAVLESRLQQVESASEHECPRQNLEGCRYAAGRLPVYVNQRRTRLAANGFHRNPAAAQHGDCRVIAMPPAIDQLEIADETQLAGSPQYDDIELAVIESGIWSDHHASAKELPVCHRNQRHPGLERFGVVHGDLHVAEAVSRELEYGAPVIQRLGRYAALAPIRI